MRSRGHGEVEHRTGRVLTDVNSLCRNHTSEAVFEREGKSVATEQGAGVEGCDPAHMREAHGPLGFSAGNQRYGVVNEPCSGPVLLDLLSINKKRSDLPSDQAPRPVVTGS